jgi:hypothetical protein
VQSRLPSSGSDDAPRAAPPLRVKLQRYFFYGWLFRDATQGRTWERVTALRHNREQSRWLPLYMLRWLTLGGVCFGIASALEASRLSPGAAALFYVLAAMTVPFNAVTGLCWLVLRLGRGPDLRRR